MDEITLFLLTQLSAMVVAILSVRFTERQRLRASGNFERKQNHYADLFDVLFNVTRALRLWHSNVFVSNETADLDAIQKELDGKDVARLDALNQIWSSKKVIETTERWIDCRKDLSSTLTNMQVFKESLTVEDRIALKQQADTSRDALVKVLEEVKVAMKEDLYLKRRWWQHICG
jgi:hypothetical protein